MLRSILFATLLSTALPAAAQPPADTPLPALVRAEITPVDPAALSVALDSLRKLQIGAATGEWAAFEALLSDNVTFYAPVEGFDGLRRGKAEARRLFAHHAANTRTSWTLMRTVGVGKEIGFEVRAEGAIAGRKGEYANNLFMLLRVDGDRIVQFREYAASTGYDDHAIGRGAFDYLKSGAR